MPSESKRGIRRDWLDRIGLELDLLGVSASERRAAPRISEISHPGGSLGIAGPALAVTRLPLQSQPMEALCAAFLAFRNPPMNAVSQAAR